MVATPWIMIATLVFLVLLGLAVFLLRGKRREPDYYTLFIFGLIWTPLGITTDNYIFFIVGLSFMAVGLAHRDRWKKNHKDWKRLGKRERQVIMAAMFIGLVLLLVGIVAFVLKHHLIFW